LSLPSLEVPVVLLQQLIIGGLIVISAWVFDHGSFRLEIRSSIELILQDCVVGHVSGKNKPTSKTGEESIPSEKLVSCFHWMSVGVVMSPLVQGDNGNSTRCTLGSVANTYS